MTLAQKLACEAPFMTPERLRRETGSRTDSATTSETRTRGNSRSSECPGSRSRGRGWSESWSAAEPLLLARGPE